MRLGMFAGIAALSLATACGLFDSSSPSIAGDYALRTVDGAALPCCAVDSAGARITIVAGTLSLGQAAPESFVVTPAGWYPGSCVHEVPNGATVDPSTFPPCGDGHFTLTLSKRFDYADGSSRTVPATVAGLYAWSERDPAMVKLVDATMIGAIDVSASGQTQLELQRVNFMGSFGPTYLFAP